MSLQPLKDEGQTLGKLDGRLIGILDTRAQVDAAVSALHGAGIPDSDLILLHGQDGINLIQRFEKEHWFFSDLPASLFCRDKSVLAEGRYALGIKVPNGQRAREIAALMKEHGGHGFMHFGMFVDTQFN
jgi:hypothetical protein